MTRAIAWFWNTGIVSTFLAGFFVVLPIAITVAIMGWAGSVIKQWLGPGSPVGNALSYVGLRFVTNPIVATVVGWLTVLVALWLLGVFVKSMGRSRVQKMFNTAVERIPLINILYKPVAQVIDMFKQDGQDEMKGMSVVYCDFGSEHGAGFLGLLASEDVYDFSGQNCHVVYIPTSPIPMTGGILFVPVSEVHKVDMRVDDLMQIYFSIGVMSSKVIPQQHITSATAD